MINGCKLKQMPANTGKIFVVFGFLVTVIFMFLPRVSEGGTMNGLSFNPKEGDAWDYELTVNIYSKRVAEGIPLEQAEKLGLSQGLKILNKVLFSCKVEKTNPVTLSLTYKKVYTEFYIDDKPLNQSLLGPLEEIEGKALSVVLSSDNSSITTTYGDIKEALLPYVRNMVPLDRFFDDFPSGVVREGSSWTGVLERDLAPSAGASSHIIERTTKTVKEFVDIDKYHCAKVDKTGDIVQNIKTAENDIIFNGSGKGTFIGIIYFDAQDGKLVKLKDEIHTKVVYDIKKDIARDGKLIIDGVIGMELNIK